MGKFYEGVREDLTLYARQLGWFHSTPDAASKAHKPGAEKEQPQTRLDRIVSNGGKPLMPDVGESGFVVAYWQDVGMVLSGGMGPVPLTASELTAWQRGIGIELMPWEFSTILEMSRAYLGARNEGTKADCPPPYGDPVNEFDRTAVAKKVTNAFKAFLQAKQ